MQRFLFGMAALTAAVWAGNAQADDGHYFYRHRDHLRFHDELEHRAFHRELEHRHAHRYPMTWRQHERLHDRLDHDAFHDHLDHRAYHRYHYRPNYYYGYPAYSPYRVYSRSYGNGAYSPRRGVSLYIVR